MTRRTQLALLVVLCAAFLAACRRNRDLALDGVFAYVSNGKSDSVSVIDLSQFRVVRTIGVGRNPTGLAASPTRNEIYAVNTASDNVSFIDCANNTVVATVGVHRAPYFMDVSSDGRRGYVANSGSANVSVIDLEKRSV